MTELREFGEAAEGAVRTIAELRGRGGEIATDRCPHLVPNCCGEPSVCGLTGCDVDPRVCRDCTVRPDRRS